MAARQTPIPAWRGFFRPPAADPAAVLRAAVWLASASRGVVAHGELVRGNRGEPSAGGLLGEDLFGPVDDAASRASHVAHIPLAAGVVHRALAPAIAACLDISEEEVWNIAYFRREIRGKSGPELLRRRLARARFPVRSPFARAGFRPRQLILDVCLVTPPAARPLLAVEAGAVQPGPDNLRYQAVVAHNRVVAAAREQGLEGIFLAMHHQRLQLAFEALCAQLGDERADRQGFLDLHDGESRLRRRDRWRWPRADAERPVLPGPIEPLDELPDTEAPPSGLAAVAEDLALVRYAGEVVLISLADGQIQQRLPVPAAQLLTVTGTQAMFLAHDGLHALDLRAGKWASGPPRHRTLVLAGDGPDGVSLDDVARGLSAQPLEAEAPLARHVCDPDHRYTWLEDDSQHGGVYRHTDGVRVLDVAASLQIDEPRPSLSPRGKLSRPKPPADDDPGLFPQHVGDGAFVLAGDRWRFFVGRVCYTSGHPDFVWGAPVSAACFSADGGRLLLVDGKRVVELVLDPAPRIARVIALTRG